MALRWGIASAGLISHDFVSALSTLPKGDHIVRAVAARSLSSAEEFAARHGIPKAFEGYEALAKDAEIGKSINFLSSRPLQFKLSLYRGCLRWSSESPAFGHLLDVAGPRQARPLREALVC